jgi:hypothetical protein
MTDEIRIEQACIEMLSEAELAQVAGGNVILLPPTLPSEE